MTRAARGAWGSTQAITGCLPLVRAGLEAVIPVAPDRIAAVPAEESESSTWESQFLESPVELKASSGEARIQPAIHLMLCPFGMINREKLPLGFAAAYASGTISLDCLPPDAFVLRIAYSAGMRTIHPVPLAPWREKVERFLVAR